MSVNMKETHDKIKKGKLEFQVIYSRKIEGSVAAFTGVIFAFQYGLTRETVAENFSRTGIDWSEFILYVSVGLLLIFLFWNDDYILSTEGVTFRRVIFYKKHKWSEFPYCAFASFFQPVRFMLLQQKIKKRKLSGSVCRTWTFYRKWQGGCGHCFQVRFRQI